MPREIRLFSVSFLDLLCCALGAVILLSLLMIVSIRTSAVEALRESFFLLDSVVWIDVHEEVKGRVGDDFDRALAAGAVPPDWPARPEIRRICEDRGASILLWYVPIEDARRAARSLRTSELRSEEGHLALTIAANAPPPAYSPVLRGSVAARVNRSLVFARAPADPKALRLYYRIEFQAGGLELRAGYYFAELLFDTGRPSAATPGPLAGGAGTPEPPGVVAYLELVGSGIGGRLVLTSHLPGQLPEPVVPPWEDFQDAEALKRLRAPARASDPVRAAVLQRRLLQIPDAYTPEWPAALLGPGPAPVPTGSTAWRPIREVVTAEPGRARPRNWSGYFALVHRRDAPFPAGSGFPMLPPDAGGAPEPGPRFAPHATQEGDILYDLYLPGLCVTPRLQ